MPKRFTETLKWDDPWFRALSPDAKLLWFWIVDKCDQAGIITPDFALCEFQTGIKRAFDKMLEIDSRVIQIADGKYIVEKFIEFQHGKLSRDCKAHNPAWQSLDKHGLIDENGEIKGYSKGIERVSKEYPYSLSKGTGNGNGISNGSSKKKEKPSIDDVRMFCSEIGLLESDADALFWKWEGNGWTNSNKPIKDWKATIRSWKAAGHIPSMKNGGNHVTQGNAINIALAKKVSTLHSTWASPSTWSDTEMKSFQQGTGGQLSELTDDEWEMLKDYLSKPDEKGFWRPKNRSKFVETFPDVWQACQRWKDAQPKTATTNSKDSVYF